MINSKLRGGEEKNKNSELSLERNETRWITAQGVAVIVCGHSVL